MAKLVPRKNKLVRLIKAPIRALAKARDFYVNNMIRCAGRYGDVCGPVGGYDHSLPRSYSLISSRNADEDLRELIRASSMKMLSMRGVANDGLMRSQSVGIGIGIGRIDEDKPCEFGGEFVEVKVHKYPRSRSYVVPRRTMVRTDAVGLSQGIRIPR